jgi:hypothetical protein
MESDKKLTEFVELLGMCAGFRCILLVAYVPQISASDFRRLQTQSGNHQNKESLGNVCVYSTFFVCC